MQFELIQCTVTLNEKGANNLTTIVKSGPDAITPAEAFILMNLHPSPGQTDDAAQFPIKDVIVVGSVERARGDEYQRLMEKYGAKVVTSLLPTGLKIPTKISELDIPRECYGKAPAAATAA